MPQDTSRLKGRISDEAIRLLALFSLAANKSTGTGHQADQDRFYDFIIQTVRDEKGLLTKELREWLMSDGWDEESAQELGQEYENGLFLLKYAQGKI